MNLAACEKEGRPPLAAAADGDEVVVVEADAGLLLLILALLLDGLDALVVLERFDLFREHADACT